MSYNNLFNTTISNNSEFNEFTVPIQSKKRKYEFVDKLDFITWKNKIDRIIFHKINKHLDELEDNLYWKWFEYNYNYKDVADMVYNQNYQRWLYDVKYYLFINFNITVCNYEYQHILQKWFNNGLNPLVASKFYKYFL